MRTVIDPDHVVLLMEMLELRVAERMALLHDGAEKEGMPQEGLLEM